MGTVPCLLQGLSLQTPWVVGMLEIKGEAQFCAWTELLKQKGFLLMIDGENHSNKICSPSKWGGLGWRRVERAVTGS